MKWRDLKRDDKSLKVEGREKWVVKWSEDLWLKVCITLDWQLCSMYLCYCTVCHVDWLSYCYLLYVFRSLLCSNYLFCVFLLFVLCLFSCFVCSAFCILFLPHVCCLLSIRVQFYRPLPPGVNPITVNKFHIILLYIYIYIYIVQLLQYIYIYIYIYIFWHSCGVLGWG